MNRKLDTNELNRPGPDEYRSMDKLPVAVVLDNVRSLSNVGSVFRTSDAFLVERLVLCGITGCPPHRDIQRTALGATESVVWEYCESAVEAVQRYRAQGYAVVAVEQCSASVLPAQLASFEKLCLVFGNEVEGVGREVIDACDVCVEIPQSGTKHSLNIAVAVGVILWEVYNKRVINSA